MTTSARTDDRADDLTFEVADDVVRTPVRYLTRFGVEIAADLYTPQGLDHSSTHPAVVVGPPHGGVKEQGPGVYGNELARRGLVALAFDPSFNGQSSGSPRHVTSPEVFAEDFSAGVDHLGTLPFVDRARISVLGICGSGGFALTAAQVDTRIAAVATTAMYDISGVGRDGWQGSQTDAGRREALDQISAQRWADVDAGEPALSPAFPDRFEPEDLDPITAEFHEYYVTERGHHPRSTGAFTITSNASHINHGALAHLPDISPRPVLLVTGTQAHSRYFTETAYAQLAEPKQLVTVPDARHIDMYDRTDMIPLDQLADFFTTTAAPASGE